MTQLSSAPQALFRSEVSAAQSQQWLGAIRLAQPISGWLIAAIATLVAGMLLAFVGIGSITKKARVTGVTIPVGGSISIGAPGSGLLVRSFIKEGDTVGAGQPLFELSNARQGESGEITALVARQLLARSRALESEHSLRQAQAQEKKQALAQRIANLYTEAIQLEQEVALTQRRHALAQESIDKYKTLQASGFVSDAQTQQKQESLIDIAARLSTLQRGKLQLEANRLALQSEQAALANHLASDLVRLESAGASLQQEIAENQNRKASLITASQGGTITTLTSQVGQSINAGQILATLIPHADKPAKQGDMQLEAHLYAPSRKAGFVALGQTVLIRYQAYPYQKFGLQRGTVTDISKTPFAPNELPASLASTILSNAQQNILGFNSNEALYRIKVKLERQSIDAYGRSQSLKPGMTLEADVVQDRRKIWEWIVEPVLAAGAGW